MRRNHITDSGCAASPRSATTKRPSSRQPDGAHRFDNIERLWESGGPQVPHLRERASFAVTSSATSIIAGPLARCAERQLPRHGNVLADVCSIKGALYLEMCFGLNVIDHNIFWDIRGDYTRPWTDIFMKPGFALNIDTGEQCVFVHNLLGRVPDPHAAWFNLDQKARILAGRTGLCRRQQGP